MDLREWHLGELSKEELIGVIHNLVEDYEKRLAKLKEDAESTSGCDRD